MRFADLLEKHNDDVAALEAWDSGKPYEQAANAEIPLVVRLFRYYAGKCGDINRSHFLLKWIHDKLVFICTFS